MQGIREDESWAKCKSAFAEAGVGNSEKALTWFIDVDVVDVSVIGSTSILTKTVGRTIVGLP